MRCVKATKSFERDQETVKTVSRPDHRAKARCELESVSDF
jgi:hypothetical protein